MATPLWRRFGLVWIACVLIASAVTPAHADEIWVAPTYQADIGGLGVASNVVWPVTPIGVVRLAWGVPDNLQTFQNAKVVLIPHAPGGAGTLTLFVCPAETSDPVAGACAGPFAHSFTGVTNQLIDVDVSAVIAPRVGVPGANYLAVLAYTTPTTTTDHIVGLRFSYTPEVPTGVATLSANTFTGTQTAPAFAGDGSGLTNLPVPSGVATLGANTFSGTQTAPAFSGSGAALTGVAKLAANTFSATQTINTGNLDLDPSTAATGAITKNGTRFLHDFGTSNTFLGLNAGNFTTTGANNTVTGSFALGSNTTGDLNTAAGVNALVNNSAGGFNTAVGVATLRDNTSGGFNVAVGYGAGANTTIGTNNIYLGANVDGVAGEANAMYLGRIGTQTKTVVAGIRGTVLAGTETVVVDATGRLGSTAVLTPSANTVGDAQVIDNSLTASDLAPDSVGISEVAFNYAASASEGGPAADLVCIACVGTGEVSFSFAGTGANTFTGTQTVNNGHLDLDHTTATTGLLTKNGTPFLHNFGGNNTFLGLNAGNLTLTGFFNTAIGPQTLRLNTTGASNTAVGYAALLNNTEGDHNTASGVDALRANTTGGANIATGSAALDSNTTGSANVATGTHALTQNVTGDSNVAVGYASLLDNTSGNLSTAVGYFALARSSGTENVALGSFAGYNLVNGANNIYLGANVEGAPGEVNTMYLGRVGTQNRTFIAGVRGVPTGIPNAVGVLIDSNGQLGTLNSSRRFKEDIHDMADSSRRLFQLRPVTFRYTKPYANGAKPIQFGLVAEEVAEVFPELAVRDANGNVETVHYETLNVLLLNEVQKQQRELTAERTSRLEEQHAQQQRIEALEQKLRDLLREREADRRTPH